MVRNYLYFFRHYYCTVVYAVEYYSNIHTSPHLWLCTVSVHWLRVTRFVIGGVTYTIQSLVSETINYCSCNQQTSEESDLPPPKIKWIEMYVWESGSTLDVHFLCQELWPTWQFGLSQALARRNSFCGPSEQSTSCINAKTRPRCIHVII